MRKLIIAVCFVFLLATIIISGGCGSGNSPITSPSSSGSAKSAAPVKLAFITQPGGASAGSPFSSQPVVALQDANGNTVTGNILPVTLTLTTSTGISDAMLFGPSSMNTVNGLAKFNGLHINKAGKDYTLMANAGNLTPVTSSAFTISPGPASKLVFTVQPSSSVAGVPFQSQPEVAVQDHYGNAVTDFNGSITMAISYGGTSTSKLLGTTTIPVVGNIARFKDLAIDTTFPNFTLTAMCDSLDSANSASFKITAATPVKLDFTVQPDGAKAGKPFDTQPKVAVEDSFGNVVDGTNFSITVSLTPDTGTAGAKLSGTKTFTAEGGLGGLAVYEDLSIDQPGSGYTLTATCDNLKSTQSQGFNVTP